MTTPYYQDDLLELHLGDATEVARTLPSDSVQTIVTSPPYYGLRDYGSDGQMGAEETVGQYVDKMVTLFRELRRALSSDGTLWLNLGDSYSGARGGPQGESGEMAGRTVALHRAAARTREPQMVSKNLLGVPWRVAFALQDDGWILRSDIIWAKPNPMPESVTDRPTKAHEYLFLFAKQPKYYYDASAIAEEATTNVISKILGRGDQGYSRASGGGGNPQRDHSGGYGYTEGHTRNKRSVWEVPTTPFSAAHFAVYPPELIRPCILAGSAPGDTVMDPFSGSGTTGMVATQEGRRYVGIDLNSDYLDLSLRTRFAQPTLNFGVSS